MIRWIAVDILIILIFIEVVQMWLFGKAFSDYLGWLSLVAFIIVIWYILERIGILPGAH